METKKTVVEYEWFDGSRWVSLGTNPGVGPRMIDNPRYRTRKTTTVVTSTGWQTVKKKADAR